MIIADDMTGMTDAAVSFAGRGILTELFRGDVGIDKLRNCKAAVAAVTTESRNLTKEEAGRRVRAVVQKARAAGVKRILKKTDSMLRGHIGAELEAAMKGAGTGEICFFPAYPQMGRFTIGGIQYLNGEPVCGSRTGGENFECPVSASVPEVLSAETDVCTEVVKEGAGWKRTVKKDRIYIFDAGSKEALRRQTEAVIEQGMPYLIAGCAGIAEELAEFMSGGAEKKRVRSPDKRMFAICGSLNETTRKQAAYAAKNGYAYIPVLVEALTEGTLEAEKYQKLVAGKIRAACLSKANIAAVPVFAGGEEKEEEGEETEREEKTEGKNRFYISESFASGREMAKVLIGSWMDCWDLLEGYTLFCTGGDTFGSLMEMRGGKRITVCGEICPGVVLNKVLFGQKEKYVISKSGGFGDEDILLKCLE